MNKILAGFLGLVALYAVFLCGSIAGGKAQERIMLRERPELMEVELQDTNGKSLVYFQAATNPSYACVTTLHGYKHFTDADGKQGLYVRVPVTNARLVFRTRQGGEGMLFQLRERHDEAEAALLLQQKEESRVREETGRERVGRPCVSGGVPEVQ